MTEFEKMRNKEFYDFTDAEVTESIIHANRLCAKLQTLTVFDDSMAVGNPARVIKSL